MNLSTENPTDELSSSIWEDCPDPFEAAWAPTAEPEPEPEPDPDPDPDDSPTWAPEEASFVVGPNGYRCLDVSMINDERKRARILKNRASAARSRQRYIERTDTTQRRVRELEAELEALRARVRELEAENQALRAHVARLAP